MAGIVVVNDLFNQLSPTLPWNNLMDDVGASLAPKRVKTIDDIANVLKRVAISRLIATAIKTAHALGCDLRILSDANMFFIETILNNIGVREYFSEINTNPSYIDEKGRLRIEPYHDSLSSPHGCNLCPPNLCKGLVIERIKASLSAEGKKFIYVGDGPGDFCPSLKLREGDYVMPRKNYPVWDLISKNRNYIRAQVHEWSNGEEFESVLLHIIKNLCVERESVSHLLSLSTHKLLHQVLPIRH